MTKKKSLIPDTKMMMKMVTMAVLRSKPPRMKVTAKTDPREMARDLKSRLYNFYLLLKACSDECSSNQGELSK